jgi:hypothetical protein
MWCWASLMHAKGRVNEVFGTMRTRGVFDPKLQLVIGLVLTTVFGFLILSPEDRAHLGSLDMRLAPLAFVAGLAVGWPIGRLRFSALERVLPILKERFYLTQWRTLSQFREGENAIKSQRIAAAVAFLTWFGLSTYTNGRILLSDCMLAFILGAYLTGHMLPFLKLWIVLRRQNETSRSV